MRGSRLLFALFVILLGLGAASARAATVLACADQAEMPPFVFAERINGQKSTHMTGASVDLLRQIGQRHGWDLQVQLLPWARCVAMVSSGGAQIAINLSEADAKANGILLSVPYFTMHNVYFYSRRARPQGIVLKHLDELRQFNLCGLGGHHFEAFGIASTNVDRGTTLGYEQLITKLHLGRCDLFIDSRETMAGQYLINPRLRSLMVDGTLVSQPLPGKPTRDLYFGVAPGEAAIQQQLNAGLEQLAKEKKLDTLLEQYLQ
jgi:polar amino acid transport system substrate-binding protein